MATPMRDAWLLSFDWPAARDGDALAALRELAPALQGWRALEGDAAIAYLPPGASSGVPREWRDAAPGGARWSRLACTLDVPGASAAQRDGQAAFHYVVATDVLAAHEADFDAWYATEHLPGLAAVPGTVRAARYLNESGAPRHHACYDLLTLETFGSPAWLAVRGTDWSSRVRPAFRNTRRTMYRRA